MISDKEGVSPDRQRVPFEGIPLEDARALENYNIKKTPPFFFCLNGQEVISNTTSSVDSLPILLSSEHCATRISDYQCQQRTISKNQRTNGGQKWLTCQVPATHTRHCGIEQQSNSRLLPHRGQRDHKQLLRPVGQEYVVQEIPIC